MLPLLRLSLKTMKTGMGIKGMAAITQPKNTLHSGKTQSPQVIWVELWSTIITNRNWNEIHGMTCYRVDGERNQSSCNMYVFSKQIDKACYDFIMFTFGSDMQQDKYDIGVYKNKLIHLLIKSKHLSCYLFSKKEHLQIY